MKSTSAIPGKIASIEILLVKIGSPSDDDPFGKDVCTAMVVRKATVTQPSDPGRGARPPGLLAT